MNDLQATRRRPAAFHTTVLLVVAAFLVGALTTEATRPASSSPRSSRARILTFAASCGSFHAVVVL